MTSSASWNTIREDHLIDSLIKEIEENGRPNEGAGFKTVAWNRIRASFTSLNNGIEFSNQQLQSKLAVLKANFIAFDTLCNQSGWGWDSERNIPTAPDSVWEEYIKVHPKAAQFRHQTLHRYDDLAKLFKGKVATGKFAVSSTAKSKTNEVTNQQTAIIPSVNTNNIANTRTPIVVHPTNGRGRSGSNGTKKQTPQTTFQQEIVTTLKRVADSVQTADSSLLFKEAMIKFRSLPSAETLDATSRVRVIKELKKSADEFLELNGDDEIEVWLSEIISS